MTARKDKPTLVVTDSKGNIHKVKTNILKQKERQAVSTPRVIVFFIIAIRGSSWLMEKTNGIASVILIVVLLLLARMFVFTVVIGREELKTLRPITAEDKLS
jgi:ABC-type xylose transport system permease subunit